MTAPQVEVRRAPELDVATLHGILQLRSAVFVVEQDCVYADIDGRIEFQFGVPRLSKMAVQNIAREIGDDFDDDEPMLPD